MEPRTNLTVWFPTTTWVPADSRTFSERQMLALRGNRLKVWYCWLLILMFCMILRAKRRVLLNYIVGMISAGVNIILIKSVEKV